LSFNKTEFKPAGESSLPRFATIIVAKVRGRRIGWTTAQERTSSHSANGRGIDN